MKVIAVTGDKGACRQYRLDSLIPHLPDGVELDVRNGLPVRKNPQGQIIGIPIEDCDVLVLQRPTAWWLPFIALAYRRAGRAVVVELDDAMDMLPAQNQARHALNPSLNRRSNWRHLARCVQAADMLTVSTPALATRYRTHPNVVVLRNCIDGDWLNITGADPDTVGWTGTLKNHTGDLRVTHGGVARAIQDCGAAFTMVGTPAGVAAELGLTEPFDHVPWISFEMYPHVVARFGVGIAPLHDSVFNRSKSWLKPLEYAALGVPAVMSPTPEYLALNELGVGVVAEPRSRAWRRAVTQLLSNERLRSELVSQQRLAAGALTVERNAWRWAEAWDSVAESRHTPPVAV